MDIKRDLESHDPHQVSDSGKLSGKEKRRGGVAYNTAGGKGWRAHSGKTVKVLNSA